MVIYAKLEPSEELAIRRAVLEAMASSIIFQNTGAEIAKLKGSKKYAMRGLSASINRIEEEIAKLRTLLPELEEKIEKPKVTRKSKVTKPTTLKEKPEKPKEKKKKSKYEEELEEIRKRIEALGNV